jgi:hypothetical protein
MAEGLWSSGSCLSLSLLIIALLDRHHRSRAALTPAAAWADERRTSLPHLATSLSSQSASGLAIIERSTVPFPKEIRRFIDTVA